MTTTQSTRHANRAEFVAHIADLAAASPHDWENWPLARKIFDWYRATMDKVEQGQ